MIVIRSLYFIATILAVAKSSTEADDVSVLAGTPFESTNVLRGSGSNDAKERESRKKDASIIESTNRILEVSKKRLLQLISITINGGCCPSPDDDGPPDDDDGELSSMYPSFTPIYEEKKLVASDGSDDDFFGASCSVSNELAIIGAPGIDDTKGGAYLFHLDGTEVAKLTSDDDYAFFGGSVSMDEKVVVGSVFGNYFSVFSRDGTYENTITCNDCGSFQGFAGYFGSAVATLGNLIVTFGFQGISWKLFIYTIEGVLLKSFDQEGDSMYSVTDVAITEQLIVLTGRVGKTIIYSNSAPDFPKIAEIDQGGYQVAVSNDRIVIGGGLANDWDGVAYLYKTDGTLVTALDRQDASSGSFFGESVAIIDDKVIVSAPLDDDQGEFSGSVFIYSAETGAFIEKILAPDGEANDLFGIVCASDSYYVVGAYGDDLTGAAYLFQSP